MHSIKLLIAGLILKENLKIVPKISLLIVLLLGACGPAVVNATPTPVQNTALGIQNPAADVVPTPTVKIPPTSTAAPVANPIYPSYLPLATKPEVPPQTINGVTTQIDWVYVDETRVAIAYTISGLDWTDGSMMDATQQVQMSIPALSNFRFGGFSGAGGANVSYVDDGVITGSSDQALLGGALDAEKHPDVHVKVDIPVEGPTKIGTFHFSFTVPVANGITIEDIDQTVVANNVSMTLKSLILSPSHAEALICFQMPSAVDWGLTASQITVGGREYPFSGGGLATEKSDPNSALTSSERCNNVGFDIAYDNASDKSIMLTVPRLQASYNEVVTKEVVDRANQRLADQGIQFDYVNVDHGGNIVILKRPEGATDPEIYPLILDALSDQYEGPWVFTLQIPK